MRVKVLHFDNFDGAGGRLNRFGICWADVTPVYLDFKTDQLVGLARLEAVDDGIVAHLDHLTQDPGGLFPAAALRLSAVEARQIPRCVSAAHVESIGLVVTPNNDRRIVPCPAVRA